MVSGELEKKDKVKEYEGKGKSDWAMTSVWATPGVGE